MECPDGLVWDPEAYTCSYPDESLLKWTDRNEIEMDILRTFWVNNCLVDSHNISYVIDSLTVNSAMADT